MQCLEEYRQKYDDDFLKMNKMWYVCMYIRAYAYMYGPLRVIYLKVKSYRER